MSETVQGVMTEKYTSMNKTKRPSSPSGRINIPPPPTPPPPPPHTHTHTHSPEIFVWTYDWADHQDWGIWMSGPGSSLAVVYLLVMTGASSPPAHNAASSLYVMLAPISSSMGEKKCVHKLMSTDTNQKLLSLFNGWTESTHNVCVCVCVLFVTYVISDKQNTHTHKAEASFFL